MGLFSRTRGQAVAPAGAETWRGRSRDLPDAGPVPWQVLFAALETGPAAVEDQDSPVGALGFSTTEQVGSWEGSGTTHLSGIRHGRQVELRIGTRDHGWSAGGAMVAWIRATAPDLRALGSHGGAFIVDPAHSPAATHALAGLAAVPAVWNGVLLRCGQEGLVTYRKMTGRTHQQGYLYDLWLLERLADAVDARPLPPSDLSGVRVPYRMG